MELKEMLNFTESVNSSEDAFRFNYNFSKVP